MENKKIKRWRSNNLAQRVKMLAAKPSDLSLPTGRTWQEERTDSRKLPSALLCAMAPAGEHTHAYAHAHTQIIIII